MGSVCRRIASGTNKTRQIEGRFPIYGSTGEIARTDKAPYEGFRLLIARVGANAGLVNAVDGCYDVSDNTLVVDFGESINGRFLFHVLVNENLNKHAKGGGQPLITASQLKRVEIPLPPLEEQARIAETLDRFDTLVNDITKGLPAEIEARRKQYAYYRDRLLSFKEKVA